MRRKIEWYQEVLALEPGSRVFFPLARLFVEFGQYEDAARTLRQGLDRHPDSMEARLLLIQVLTKLERLDEASEQLAMIIKPLERYPAFWTLWARQVGEADRDFSAFLLLVASHFSDKPVSWSDVVMEGLHSITARLMDALPKAAVRPVRQSAQPAASTASASPTSSAAVAGGASAPVEHDAPTAAIPAPPSRPAASAPAAAPVRAASSAPASSAATASSAAPAGDAAPSGESTETPYEGPAPEPGIYRTRTMADLLASQGDFAGALTIFRQLQAVAPGEMERGEISGRIKALEAELAAAPPQDESHAASAPAEADPFGKHAKNRLMSTLEALAARLESRVQQA